DTEIPSPAAGVLQQIIAQEDETVEVGATLAVIGEKGAAPAAPAPEQPTPEPEPAAQPEPAPQPAAAASTAPAPAPEQPKPTAPAQPSTTPASAPYVTPLVRKLANEHGIDLTKIKGSGVGGRIRKQDVQAAIDAKKAGESAAPAASAPAAAASVEPSEEAKALRGTTQKMSRLRQLLANRMVESLHTAAQLTTVIEVDVTRIARLRERAKASFEASEGVKLSFLPFFAKATAEALKLHPKLNASIDEENKEIVYHGAEHLSIAVDTDRGLVSPVIHNAGDLNLGGLARKIADLAERTRNNKIKPDELSGGTFTITNTGSRGALFDTPILNPPQVGM